MKWWKSLDPGQRRMLAIGAPIVAVLALVTVLRGRGSTPSTDEAAPEAAQLPPLSLPSTDAIGVGQLASFQDAITGQIDVLSRQIDERAQQPAEEPAAATLPKTLTVLDAPATPGIYDIEETAFRVSNTGHARQLSEYGSAGGARALIDTMADVAFVAAARGHPDDLALAARVILRGSFGPIATTFRPQLERLANQ